MNAAVTLTLLKVTVFSILVCNLQREVFLV